MKTIIFISISLLIIGILSCKTEIPEYKPPEDFAIIFETGYEPDEAIGTPSDAHEQITYQNTAEPPVSSEHYDLPQPVIVNFVYEGGTALDRYGRIIEDPTQSLNHVLHYWLKNATIPAYESHTKGRIQQNFSMGDHPEGDYIVELYAKQNIYLHPDFSLITDYDLQDNWWLEPMIHELWMENEDYLSRISVYLAEGDPDEINIYTSFSYKLNGDDSWEHYWEEPGDIAIPVGEWFTMEIGWKMGDADNGRFILTIQRDGDANPVTVIDVTNWTYNPDSPLPIPLSNWNPQKLYGSDNIIHFVRDNGGILQMYFDDFSFSDSIPEKWK
jgi:hypothetical protein